MAVWTREHVADFYEHNNSPINAFTNAFTREKYAVLERVRCTVSVSGSWASAEHVYLLDPVSTSLVYRGRGSWRRDCQPAAVQGSSAVLADRTSGLVRLVAKDGRHLVVRDQVPGRDPNLRCNVLRHKSPPVGLKEFRRAEHAGRLLTWQTGSRLTDTRPDRDH